MKTNNRFDFIHSILFKGVVIHLLLFAFFYYLTSPWMSTIGAYRYILFYFLSLAVLLIFLGSLSAKLKKLNDQVDAFTSGQYKLRKSISGNNEINLLYDKVLTLGSSVENAKESWENQRNQLNGILTYMTDGVIATDRRGKIVLANKAAKAYLNISGQRIVGARLVDILHLKDKYSFRDLLEKEPEVTIDSENTYGEYVNLRVKFALFRRESGYISGIVAVLHDTTDQEKAERERRLFVSNVSHELRTPLTSVKSYLEALDDGAYKDPKIAPGFIQTSLTETDRMIRMISDLLTLSRMDQTTVVLEKEVVNFIAFLHFQLNRFDHILEKEGKTFKIIRKLPFHPVWIEIDPDKMGQVIDNLINNAIKYSPEGGEITVLLELSNTQIILKVSDQGMGIPRQDLPKIFDRFYRVDKARTRAAGGTGLGLAIVHDIIKMHDGFIWAKSDGVSGSTFTVILPYSPVLGDSEEIEDDGWE